MNSLKTILRNRLSKNSTEDFLDTMDKMSKKVGKERDAFIVEAFIRFMNNDSSEDGERQKFFLDIVQQHTEKLKH